MQNRTCPTCGARALQYVVTAVVFEIKGKPKTIPDVPHWRCSSCGEELFDRDSNRVLDPHRERKNGPSVA